jgi:hypothetical protein
VLESDREITDLVPSEPSVYGPGLEPAQNAEKEIEQVRRLVEEEPAGQASVPGREPPPRIRELKPVYGFDLAQAAGLDELEQACARTRELEVVDDAQHEAGTLRVLGELRSGIGGQRERLLTQAVPPAIQRDANERRVLEWWRTDCQAVRLTRPRLVEGAPEVWQSELRGESHGSLGIPVDHTEHTHPWIGAQSGEVTVPRDPTSARTDDWERQRVRLS